jgi:ferredoxin
MVSLKKWKKGGCEMKAIVDKEACIGCELCVQTCPEVFEMQGDKAEVIAEPVPEDAEDTCKEAAENCPVDAISTE